MSTWQYILVGLIVVVGIAVAYLMGFRRARKDTRMAILGSVLANVFNPIDMISFIESEAQDFTEEQKTAVVIHQRFMLEKLDKFVEEVEN